jgi:hypothetical protein
MAEWFEGLSYVVDSTRVGFDPSIYLIFFTARGTVGWQNNVRGRTTSYPYNINK